MTYELSQHLHWAMMGQATSQYVVAMAYYHGWDDVTTDYAEAVRWFGYASAQGDGESSFMLGWCYENGTGVPADHTLAQHYWMLAAGQGYPRACLWAADCCHYGWQPFLKDDSRAVGYLEVAAGADNAEACYKLGWYYYFSSEAARDEQKGLQYTRKAAELGYKPAQSWLPEMEAFSYL